MIDDKRLETSPLQHIRNLLQSIKDGTLSITCYDPIEPPYSLDYKVSCTEADSEDIISKYSNLTSALEKIGEIRRIMEDDESPINLLTPDQLDVWNTYICELEEVFDSEGYDLGELYSRRACGDELNDEEQEILEKHYLWCEAESLKHLPKRVRSPIHLVIRARRYEYLVRKSAPKKIIDEEGRCLAEQMILYHYCI